MVLVLWWFWSNGYGRSSETGVTGSLSLSSFFHPVSPEEQPAADTTSGGFNFSPPPLGDNTPPTPPIGIVIGGPTNTPPSGNKGQQGGNTQPNFATMPEPSTLTLLGLGIASLAGYGWRRRNVQD